MALAETYPDAKWFPRGAPAAISGPFPATAVCNHTPSLTSIIWKSGCSLISVSLSRITMAGVTKRLAIQADIGSLS